MSDPLTMTLISTGLSAVGSIMQGNAQADAEKASADANAAIAKHNAKLAELQGQEEEERLRREKAEHLGKIKAARGASGITLEGTALDVLASEAMSAELDILNSRFNKEVEVSKFKDQARFEIFKGDQRAKAAKSAGFAGALTSVAGGVVSAGPSIAAKITNGGSGLLGSGGFGPRIGGGTPAPAPLRRR